MASTVRSHPEGCLVVGAANQGERAERSVASACSSFIPGIWRCPTSYRFASSYQARPFRGKSLPRGVPSPPCVSECGRTESNSTIRLAPPATFSSEQPHICRSRSPSSTSTLGRIMKLVPALSLFSLVPIALVGCTAPASPRADGHLTRPSPNGYELGNYNPVAGSARRGARPRCTTGGPALRGPGLRYPGARARARSRDAGPDAEREGVDRRIRGRRPIHGRHDVRTARTSSPPTARFSIPRRVAAGHVRTTCSSQCRPPPDTVSSGSPIRTRRGPQAAARDRTVRTADRGLAAVAAQQRTGGHAPTRGVVAGRPGRVRGQRGLLDGAPQVREAHRGYVPDDNARPSGWRPANSTGPTFRRSWRTTFADRNGYEVVATRRGLARRDAARRQHRSPPIRRCHGTQPRGGPGGDGREHPSPGTDGPRPPRCRRCTATPTSRVPCSRSTASRRSRSCPTQAGCRAPTGCASGTCPRRVPPSCTSRRTPAPGPVAGVRLRRIEDRVGG